MDEFTKGYIECALWCGLEETDKGADITDIAPESLERMQADCSAFQADNEALLTRWYEQESDSRAGHDFWLTRNRHGAGFWDRFSGGHELHGTGRALTDAAHAYGSADLYRGDDGKVYQA